jgi:predicted nuclease of predicted toxin-antitoxin system
VRVLLDEQMPRDLVAELIRHEARKVGQLGWKGLGNGELLAQASQNFDVLLTMDKRIPLDIDITHQQIRLILVRALNNRIEALRPGSRSANR